MRSVNFDELKKRKRNKNKTTKKRSKQIKTRKLNKNKVHDPWFLGKLIETKYKISIKE